MDVIIGKFSGAMEDSKRSVRISMGRDIDFCIKTPMLIELNLKCFLIENDI
jgi:hypothetical protein